MKTRKGHNKGIYFHHLTFLQDKKIVIIPTPVIINQIISMKLIQKLVFPKKMLS